MYVLIDHIYMGRPLKIISYTYTYGWGREGVWLESPYVRHDREKMIYVLLSVFI
jgi:hypothetical protein